MTRRPLVRVLLASVATAAAIMLAGCNTAEEYLSKSSLRAQQPLSPKMLALLDKKNMDKGSPILVRVFKEESQLEVWKKARDGRYALLKTYPICRWSGALGPKVKEGDRQAPEGFYEITPGQMNPNSNYYLAFNTGFPNAYDRAWGRSGSDLMVHGDCSSRGCYAMTDEQIGEIYALARESFFGGQRAFQFEAFPFRMTALNMARHRNNPNMPFWKMLKVGYDHFEVTHLEPKVNVCERHYVFDAEAPGGKALNFTPAGKCPTYQVSPDIAEAVAAKEQQDDIQEATLISQGTPTVPVKTGVDGGMNPVFLAALTRHEQVEAAQGDTVPLPTPTATGTIPALVNPPHVTQVAYGEAAAPAAGAPELAAASARTYVGRPQPEPRAKAVAHRAPKAPEHVRAAERKEPAAPHVAARHVAAKSEAKPHAAAAAHGAPRVPPLRGSTALASAGKSTSARPSTMDSLMHPGLPATATAMAAPTRPMRGAQPVLQTGTFESRWSALR